MYTFTNQFSGPSLASARGDDEWAAFRLSGLLAVRNMGVIDGGYGPGLSP